MEPSQQVTRNKLFGASANNSIGASANNSNSWFSPRLFGNKQLDPTNAKS